MLSTAYAIREILRKSIDRQQKQKKSPLAWSGPRGIVLTTRLPPQARFQLNGAGPPYASCAAPKQPKPLGASMAGFVLRGRKSWQGHQYRSDFAQVDERFSQVLPLDEVRATINNPGSTGSLEKGTDGIRVPVPCHAGFEKKKNRR